MRFSRLEVNHLITAIITVGIVVVLNLNKQVQFSGIALTNFARIMLLVSVVILSREAIHKFFAYRYKVILEYRLWSIGENVYNKKGIKTRGILKSIPTGVILALLFGVFSSGKLLFLAISSYAIRENKAHRLGRRFSRLTSFEDAKIASAGVLTNVLLATTFSMINSALFWDFIFLNYAYALFHLLPFPNLAGAKIFFCDISLYVFVSTLAVSSFLISVLDMGSLALVLIIAVIFSIATFYFLKKP